MREVKPDTIKVHYFGWGSKWDAELPRKSGSGSKVCVHFSQCACVVWGFTCNLPAMFMSFIRVIAFPTGAFMDQICKLARADQGGRRG